MTEDRLRKIVSLALSNPKVTVRPEDITDESSVETVPTWDSHAVMEICLMLEPEVGYMLDDDEVARLTSWPAVKAVVAAHG